jgi:crotonobetainyl-CoA:carnitine CoA-transferase CaiB-like acyl-CoA transferase
VFVISSEDDTPVEGPQRSAPLKNIVVADFSRILAGPFASMLLGDFGATVIKVENPDGGDGTRAWGPPFDNDGVSTYYQSINRNKRSVRLDLQDPTDVALARELANRSDVLIENFRSGTMEKFGLGYAELAKGNPGLIYCSISGFGQGVGRDLPGYDFLAQAAGGLMSITGLASGEPTKTGVAVGDVVTGLFSVIGILVALNERAVSGRGQRVDTNLLHSVLGLLVNHASAFLIAGEVPGIQGNAHSSIAPYETFHALDGNIVVAVGNDRQFAKMCDVLELGRLPKNPDYSVNSARVKNREALHQVLEERISTMPVEHWTDMFADVGVPSGKINPIDEAFEFAEKLGLSATYTHLLSGIGAPPQVSNPITLSETPPTYRQPPPGLGEHDDDVRQWLNAPRERDDSTKAQ